MAAVSNASLFERALRVIPGGVNSPVRAFRAVGGGPPFLRRGAGSHVWDEEGREYLDLVGSWGPLILGHAPEPVVEAITRAARDGTSFGASTVTEIEMAETIVEAVPSIESVRLVSSGTEATMSALRLARGVTGKDLLIKFDGGYHGHADSFLIQAGSGAATLGYPSSPGVTAGMARDTAVARYNDLASVERIVADNPGRLAAIIVEPVAANIGCLLPAHGFLQGLRNICDREKAALIFDEVITGFRLGWGGAQERFSVLPDLTTLGKVIGGGLPVGAYGGRRDWMRYLAPEGPIYQAGTLSGNPLAVAAGRATLEMLRDGAVYRRLEALGARLAAGLNRAVADLGGESSYVGIASLGTLWFRPFLPQNADEAREADTGRFAIFFREMLRRSIYIAPSQFEAWFLSAAHTEEEIDRVVAAARESLAVAQGERA
ncbi:MAG: glutamate-1-semialdehyde 2,1-aminomutase [Candidatus Eisenbacteria bacterium]|nr:glutamate-1-semialdehyde 2,1-aminomutase [Candidatus Eisenbacteria bacterium]